MLGVLRAAMPSLLLLAVPGQVEAACMLSSIASNFNGTPIAAGHFIWFNSVFNVTGLPSPLTSPVTISFDQSTIQFTANSTPFNLAVPNATITISPSVSTATTTFDTTTNTWVTVVQPGLPGNTFLAGLVFPVTSNLPGGINPVTWSGRFSSPTSGLTVQWQWSAAVYTSFSTDNNALGVKPIDANTGSIYLNSDHAGTPENFKPFVIGGARGGGGSNFTGSYSATASQAISCKLGSITVDKETSPSGDPTPFSFATAGGPSAITDPFQLTDASPPHTTGHLEAGVYTVTETVPGGWTLTGATCVGGPFGAGMPYTNGAGISLGSGDEVTCTFFDTSNQPSQTGEITVDKVTKPSGSSQLFTFTTAGGASSDTFQLADATNPHTTSNLQPGTYHVTEAVPAGWTLAGATCVGGPFGAGGPYTNGANFVLQAGDSVLCTFTDTLPARITVDKETSPSGDPQLFSFATAGGPSALTDTFQLADATPPHTTGNLEPGDYSVTETVPAGWMLEGATCVGGPFGAGAPYTNGALMTLDNGDNVTCTFIDSKQPPGPTGSITVDKATTPAGSSQLFTFTTAGGVVTDTFQLMDTTPPHTTGNLGPGTYSVTETVPPGWLLVGATCVGGPFGAGGPYTNGDPFVLQAGDAVLCTFTDALAARITVDKVTIPGGDPQLFTFTTAGGPFAVSDTFQIADASPPHTTDNLAPGSYTVTETVPADWALVGATCVGGQFGTGAPYANGATLDLNAGDQVSCTFTDFKVRPAGPDFCSKSAVRSVLNPSATRFMNNAGLDHLVRTDLGESIQQALDIVGDVNGDGYVLIGVITNGSGARGGNTTQHVEINRTYPVPFGLIGCSVTLHDPDAGDGLPTASIKASSSNPPSSRANPSFTGESSIFVMDLHAADSEVAGWVIEGDKRELRNVQTTRNVTGVVILGDNNTMHNGSATRNATIGVDVQGNGNALETVQAMANGSFGIRVSATNNTIYQGKVGDRGKGNGSDGISVTGTGHVIRENTVYANGGNGIFVTGTNHQLLKNTTGAAGKGNALTGVLVQGSGILMQENRASANGDAGFDISGGTSGAPNRVRSNLSNAGPSGGTSENRGPEYRLLGVVSSPGGGNKADSVLVPKTSVPVKCPTFPATNATVNFTSLTLCE